jgi:RNA polymerase sigma-70 factor (ECF subfamily)
MSRSSAIRRGPQPAALGWALRIVPTARPETVADGSPAALTDAELVARALEGEARAFDVLVERHRRAVYQVCYRFVHHHEDASDLAQDVFVRAWRGLGRFKREAAFTTWLYRIAVNTCLNNRSARSVPAEPLEVADRFEDTQAERPGAELQRAERAAAVRRAIRALPDKQRATLVLRLYHELSHQEIADILGSSVGTVKANFFHALGKMKTILGSEP